MSHANTKLIDAIRAQLEISADPERAPQMQAYMKSTMPFFGVPAPDVKRICREAFAAHPLETFEAWRDTVDALFTTAIHREQWYAAVNLADLPRYRTFARDRRALPLYESMVTGSAWWDIVDAVASHLLCGLYATESAWTAEQMRTWSTDTSMWKRRSAILSQLNRKDNTDLALLYECIEPNIDDPEFFIRKAIGWALRQVAWRDPDEVIRYVTEHRDCLSPLSKREALKNVLKSGRITAIP